MISSLKVATLGRGVSQSIESESNAAEALVAGTELMRIFTMRAHVVAAKPCVGRLRSGDVVVGRDGRRTGIRSRMTRRGGARWWPGQRSVAGSTLMSRDDSQATGAGHPQVFFSYSRKDKKTVDVIRGELEEAGASVWQDTEGIVGGQ